MTSKYQVSIPKALAEQLRIAPGDDVDWRIAGDELRIAPAKKERVLTVEQRLALFDAASQRQAARNKGRQAASGHGRGWSREDLYDRGRTR